MLTGAATSVGSLPHRDADAAAELVLAAHPDLPAAPELPRRSPLEGMVARAARGIQGVAVRADGTLAVDASALDPAAPVGVRLDGAGSAGFLAFLALASSAGRTGPVKIQLTGPVTLGQALVRAGAEPAVAFEVARTAVRAAGRSLVARVRRRLPGAPLLAVLDEPGLVAVGTPDLPLPGDALVDLLSAALAALEPDAVTGVHCCGPTDWRLVAEAGPVVLSLPEPEAALGTAPEALGAHLDRGGWVAWGAVPTTEPLGADVGRLWRRLSDTWRALEAAGADPVGLRERALVSPACGLAGHGPSQSERVLRLTTALGARLADRSAAGPEALSPPR